MEITVIGSGAMGCLFGAMLAEGGHGVRLLGRSREKVEAILETGVRIASASGERAVFLPADTDPGRMPPAELTLIFVKSMDTRSAAEAAARLTRPDGWVLTLQNGMGNAEVIEAACPGHRLLVGTTAHGATLLGPGFIRHAGAGPTVVGAWKQGDGEGVGAVAALFTEAGIAARAVADIRRYLWEKLMINAGINAITALTGIRNGEILDLEETRWIAREAVREAAAVAGASGYPISDENLDRVFEVARNTAMNRSSMGQDVDRRRPTEIGAINGYVLEEARRHGLPVPVNRTLTGLVRTLETHYLKSSP